MLPCVTCLQVAMLHKKGIDWGLLLSGLPLLVLSRAANIFPVAYVANLGEWDGRLQPAWSWVMLLACLLACLMAHWLDVLFLGPCLTS